MSHDKLILAKKDWWRDSYYVLLIFHLAQDEQGYYNTLIWNDKASSFSKQKC